MDGATGTGIVAGHGLLGVAAADAAQRRQQTERDRARRSDEPANERSAAPDAPIRSTGEADSPNADTRRDDAPPPPRLDRTG